MPFPDSQYPSVLRGYDKRQSERLLNAAPDLLDACRAILFQVIQGPVLERDACVAKARAAIAKAEGR